MLKLFSLWAANVFLSFFPLSLSLTNDRERPCSLGCLASSDDGGFCCNRPAGIHSGWEEGETLITRLCSYGYHSLSDPFTQSFTLRLPFSRGVFLLFNIPPNYSGGNESEANEAAFG